MKHTYRMTALALLICMLLCMGCTLAEGNGANWMNYTAVSRENFDQTIAALKNDYAQLEEELLTMTPVTPQEVKSGVLYYVYQQRILTGLSGGMICVYPVTQGDLYLMTTVIEAADPGFPAVIYFDDDMQYLSHDYSNEKNQTMTVNRGPLNVPEGAKYMYVQSYKAQQPVVERFSMALYDAVGAPYQVTEGTLYYNKGSRTVGVDYSKLYTVPVEQGVHYYVTTSLEAQDPGFALITYFDADNNVVGKQFDNTANSTTAIRNRVLAVPDNAAYFCVNARKSSAMILRTTPKTNRLEAATHKQVSILFVGNSLTQDGIAYLPYLLKTYYPEVDFCFYMWYNGGKNLEEQYGYFTSNTPCEIFSVAENTARWTSRRATMQEILTTYRFDAVCLQEYFNHKTSYDDCTDWNNCAAYIQQHYTGGNGLKFYSMFHAPQRSYVDTVFSLVKAGNARIMRETICEGIIPMGISVYRALPTDLDTLGDRGHLSPDGVHTQEGLPCLIQTYVAALWLFDEYGINKSIYGLPMVMTDEIYSSINVPGANIGSGVVPGTAEQNILAQEIAIKAYKEGKKLEADNWSVN